jgi:hypothetical protein
VDFNELMRLGLPWPRLAYYPNCHGHFGGMGIQSDIFFCSQQVFGKNVRAARGVVGFLRYDRKVGSRDTGIRDKNSGHQESSNWLLAVSRFAIDTLQKSY